MKEIEYIIQEPQHHAYIIFGTHELKEPCKSSDGLLYTMQTDKELTVDQVRELQEYAVQTTGDETRKVLLYAQGITTQAQNALLKILEETQQGVFFFICLPSGVKVLDTLASRCYVIESREKKSKLSEHFTQFIKKTPKERLDMIDALWEQKDTSRHVGILQLLHDLELHMQQTIAKDAHTKKEHLYRCKKAGKSLRDGIYQGALHKGTLQLMAFI